MSRISRNTPDWRVFHRRLHGWYDERGRKDLPWRQTPDPYAIYVSEIMLQQTQVKTVLERYYFQFLKRFPTLSKLASAKQNEVLQAWQGLGYYNRAINLHQAAKLCVFPLPTPLPLAGEGSALTRAASQCAGEGILPRSIEQLMSLPGIGRNTAHAIAAFAYHQPVAVMEANVRRVLARIFALKHPAETELWDKAALLLDKGNPFDYNQAMMDLGAMVCLRRAPRCGECPAQTICKGKTSPESFPALKTKKTVPVRKKDIVVLRNPEGKYFATPRQTKFLNGLYHFVEITSPSPLGGGPGWGLTCSDLPSCAPHLTSPLMGEGLGSIRQQYSHFTLEAKVWLKMVKKTKGKNWHSLKQLKKLPVSMAEKKILGLLS